MDRREFVKLSLTTALVSSGVPHTLFAEKSGEMQYRTLGRTGEKVSIVGLGGYHIGMQKDASESIGIIHAALDHGMNFMDNCWDYNDGESEVRMGKALQDGYRQKAFLMTKIDGRDHKTAAQQIDESLKRLQTDHIDLLQFHEIIRMSDPEKILGPGGGMEAALAARKAGKIRYIGFTGHKDPFVHLRMLEIAAQHKFHFDTAQMPINVLDASFRSFRHQVVPKLVEQGIALLGMKPLASGAIPQNNIASAVECLHYALSQPTSVVINGCDSMERLDQAFEAARTFKPLTQAQTDALVSRTREAALSGKFELFKTSMRFDGTAQHPEWMS